MNKQQLIAHLAQQTGVTRANVEAVLDGLAPTVAAQLAGGEDVTLLGIGKFHTGERAARSGRNPRTGEEIQIAASTVVKFTPAKALKDAVNA